MSTEMIIGVIVGYALCVGLLIRACGWLNMKDDQIRRMFTRRKK